MEILFSSLLTIAIGFIGYKLQQTDKEADASRANKQVQYIALNKVVCALLRDKLLHYHKYNVEEFWEIPSYKCETYASVRDAYFALDGLVFKWEVVNKWQQVEVLQQMQLMV